MTDKLKPTAEQIQRACDLANAGRSKALWFPANYGSYTMLTYIADTLARAEKAEADLRRVDDIVAGYCLGTPQQRLDRIGAIAAPYRVETDPLVAICEALGLGPSPTAAEVLRAQLAKRGVTVGGQTDAN